MGISLPSTSLVTATSEINPVVTSPANQLLRMINRGRESEGLQPLKLNSSLSKVALAHSNDMLRNDFFDHESPRTGRLKDRLDRGGIDYHVAGENLALASTLTEVNDILFKSPGHRANLLNPEFTNVGLGIVRTDDGRFLVTQVFSGPESEEKDTRTVEREVLRELNASRTSGGTPPLSNDPNLQDAARANSNEVLRTGRIDIDKLKDIIQVRRPFATDVHAFVFRNPSINSILKLDAGTDPTLQTVGIGMSDDSNGPATVLFGTDR